MGKGGSTASNQENRNLKPKTNYIINNTNLSRSKFYFTLGLALTKRVTTKHYPKTNKSKMVYIVPDKMGSLVYLG